MFNVHKYCFLCIVDFNLSVWLFYRDDRYDYNIFTLLTINELLNSNFSTCCITHLLWQKKIPTKISHFFPSPLVAPWRRFRTSPPGFWEVNRWGQVWQIRGKYVENTWNSGKIFVWNNILPCLLQDINITTEDPPFVDLFHWRAKVHCLAAKSKNIIFD